MKKKLLFGLFTVLSTFVLSQTPAFFLKGISSSDEIEFRKFKYNSNDRLSSTDVQLSDNLSYRDTLTYDASNHVIRQDTFQLLEDDWKQVYYIEYTYDGNGNLVSRANYNNFDGTEYELGGIYNYFYENNLLSGWELLMGGTNLIEAGELTYDADGKLIQELTQTNWNGPMEDAWKSEYLYNSDDTLQKIISSDWDGFSWIEFSSDWFFYDVDKNCIKWEHKNGNKVTNKNEYEYDMDYSFDELIFPHTPADRANVESLVEMRNMPVLKHWYTENDLGDLIYVCDFIYEYEPYQTMGTNDHLTSNSVFVYPNPVLDELHVNAAESLIKNIEILDLTGRTVLKNSDVNSRETRLNTSSLNPGVYILKIKTENGNLINKKIIVK